MLKTLKNKENRINNDISTLMGYPEIQKTTSKSQGRLPLIPTNMRVSSQSKRHQYFEPNKKSLKKSRNLTKETLSR